MPTICVDTNVPASAIPESFVKDLSQLASKVIGKPETYICVTVRPGALMSFGGSTDPCAFISVSSIGKISPEENQQHSAALTPFIAESLKVADDRFYICFVDQNADYVSWKGQTFGERFRAAAAKSP